MAKLKERIAVMEKHAHQFATPPIEASRVKGPDGWSEWQMNLAQICAAQITDEEREALVIPILGPNYDRRRIARLVELCATAHQRKTEHETHRLNH